MKNSIYIIIKLFAFTFFFIFSHNVFATKFNVKFSKNKEHTAKCFEDYNSFFEKIKHNPRDVCVIIDESLQCQKRNAILYHKKIDTYYINKVLKNYSYCLDNSTVSSLYNIFIPNRSQGKKKFAAQFEKSNFIYYHDYDAAKSLYKKFPNHISEEQLYSLYGYALLKDPVFANEIRANINTKIQSEEGYVCNFVKTSILASLTTARDYKTPVDLKYLENMLSRYDVCYNKDQSENIIHVQKLFDIVLSAENRLEKLVPLLGKRKSKSFPYADFSAAKIIFSRYPDYLNDDQLSLLYEYALAFDLDFGEELFNYFKNEIEGAHIFIYHELSKEEKSELIQRIMSIL
ncbi:hypothetical protein [Fluviispira sanaruensis]|uniref:Uncharacterized protein n=1 Tax=Fluviispira sanaruensis TaxID=2493639 RepID=A0A4P2VUZ7_FLUSA|nr:hypothetical protein [Fluviispira sanaruensis]BBH52712.1 hypothetical protein JCM31447_11540 [Fluviispira sanaruensis]